MDYKVGFFYNIVTTRSYHDNRLILCFENNHLIFKLFSPSLLPQGLNLANFGGYYDFKHPVLYKEDSTGNITKLLFLEDVIKSTDGIDGITLRNTNPDVNNPSLLLNGEDAFAQAIESSTTQFYKSVINYMWAQKQVQGLKRETRPIILLEPCIKYAERIKEYIDTIHLSEILNDLSVVVTDYLRTKIGDDDTYFIDREAWVSNPIAWNDIYLKTIIGLGKTCIYKDSGYTNQLERYASDFISQHPLGKYEGELLELEKQRIISLYSKEMHMAYLLAERLNEREYNREYRVSKWENYYKTAYDILLEDFHLKSVSNTDRSFEKKIYPLEDRYGNAAEIVEHINLSIKESTHYHR